MSRWGYFVTLEGVEGSGKSTLMQGLRVRLEERGLPVVLTREPGGTPEAERIRDILLGPHDLEPLSEVFLLLAARRENVYKVILPALRNRKVVLCDRYMDSTFAYQGFGRGLPLKLLSRLNKTATGGLKPHLTFLVDLPPDVGVERKRGTLLDRFEREGIEFHRRVREGYLILARKAKRRFVVLDGTLSPEELLSRAWTVLEERLVEKGFLKVPKQ